uniref:WD_REPEATS_REGION domain-containing protein n=1 Tax=Panagrellus redivivus TaxID=6233 RepID=A0A7E4VJE4_PANRE
MGPTTDRPPAALAVAALAVAARALTRNGSSRCRREASSPAAAFIAAGIGDGLELRLLALRLWQQDCGTGGTGKVEWRRGLRCQCESGDEVEMGWLNSDEVLSAGDDHVVLKWTIGKRDCVPMPALKGTTYPLGLHFYPRGIGGKHVANDIFLLPSTDGKIQIISAAGKVEKTIDAHEGAALCAKWSSDGTSFASCGEDGLVKMWSRNGMLRSVLAQNARPVYALDWNSDSTKVAYCSGDLCFIKSLKAHTAPTKWKAHDGITLCIDWSVSSELLVTGGEDCKYRVWDAYGRPVYTSVSHHYPVTSVSWSPDGELFAVGSFNILRLCDKVGWSHSLEKLNSGSVYSICWSPDGTQIVAGSGSGQLIHAHVIDRRYWWNNLEVLQSGRNVIEVRDVLSEVAKDKLETRDRITKLQLGFGHLVVATTRQCYVYSSKNWNTPLILDLKECAVSLIMLCEKYFLMVDGGQINVLNYEGRVQTPIKLPGSVQGEAVTERTSAISNDVIAFRDRTHHNTVHLFETATGKAAGDGKIEHSVDITNIVLNQCGPIADRRLVFIDVNGDAFVALINTYAAYQRIEKIGSMVTDIMFNTSTNMLAGLQERKLLIWTNPSVVFTDKDLLQRSIAELEVEDLGKSPYLISFVGNVITIRRSDGCLIPCAVPPYPAGILNCVNGNKWDQAIRLCRILKDEVLWALLASLAAANKNFFVAEIAYGELSEPEKVIFLNEIRSETNPQIKSALMTLFNGNARDAQLNLAQNGHTFRAIMTCLSLFQFDKALDMAVRTKTHVDTVVGYRQKYLEKTGRKENDPKFLKQLAEVEIDWQHIQEKIKEEYDKERIAK